MSSQIYDCLIIGGGPAGLTAGLTMGRMGRPVVVFDSKEYRDKNSKYMHMVIANDHVNPAEWRNQARQQILDRYKMIEFQYTKILTATKVELGTGRKGFEVQDEQGKSWRGKTIIMATGTMDILPDNIEGYKENWAKHIFHCYVCQGQEYTNQTIGILGWPSGMFALYTQTALAFSDNIIVFGNGQIANDEFSQASLKTANERGIRLEERRVKRLIDNGSGDEDGVSVELEDGEKIKVGILYHHPAVASRGKNLIEQLGIAMTPEMGPLGSGGDIVVERFNKTNVSGVYGAGDTTAPHKSYTIAMSGGNIAAMGVCYELVMEEAVAPTKRIDG